MPLVSLGQNSTSTPTKPMITETRPPLVILSPEINKGAARMVTKGIQPMTTAAMALSTYCCPQATMMKGMVASSRAISI